VKFFKSGIKLKEEIKQIIKKHFPEMDGEEKLLIKLMEKDAISKEKAVKIRITKFIGNLIKLNRLKKTKDEKICLTGLGYGIACGAKKIHGD